MSQACPSLRPCLLYSTAAASDQASQIARAGPLAVNHEPVWSLCPLTGAGARETGGSTHLGGEIVLL